MQIRSWRAKFCYILVVGLLLGHCEVTQAGWTGLINGLGVGWASVNVRSATLNSNRVTTVTSLASPSAAMAPTTGYKTNAPLPGGSSTNTFSRIKGLPGGIWQASANAANGDGTDNGELDTNVTVTPAQCATIVVNTQIDQTQQQFQANGNSGTITVNANATAGTALWLRGYEYDGPITDIPPDDPTTTQNESIEFLKIHGTLKFSTILLGPFAYGGSNCPLVIPFSLQSSNLENLIFAVDSTAKSLPITIQCPSNVVVHCGDPVYYPPVTASGCGNVSLSFFPSVPGTGFFPPGFFAVGTNPVQVTAIDDSGNTTNCSFSVIVVDNTPPVVPTLPVLTGECSVQVPTPIAPDICGGVTNLIAGTTSDPTNYTTQGTFTVHWSFNDGHGNIALSNQTVIVKDVTAPVPPALPDINYNICSGTPFTPPTPVATDNCKGPVNGTTTNVFPLTTVGTTVVTWTFDDGNGNISTATQNVNLTGITFTGFFSPIGGTGGACSSPLRTINQGSVIPVKFDMTCGTNAITSGTPPVVKIQAYSSNCTPGATLLTLNAQFQNDWHINWDTTGWSKGLYRVVALLPDGTSQFAFVRLK